MKRIRKNLVRIEAMLIAVIMTVSMFANVGVNAAEIQGDNVVSMAVTEDVDASEVVTAAEDASTLKVESEEISVAVAENETEENEVADVEEISVSEEAGNDIQEEVEEIEVSETEEASEEILMFIDEPERLIQAGGFDICDEPLTANELVVRDLIYDGIKNKKPRIDVSKYGYIYDPTIETCAALKKIYFAVVNEHPELYYVTTSLSISYYPDNSVAAVLPIYMDGYNENAFNNAVSRALEVVEPWMTDAEKAIALHDYIAMSTKYNYTVGNHGSVKMPDNIYTAYGVFVNQDAVCQGYALAYKLLLDKCGIKSGVVTSDGAKHAWNYIILDDKCYYVDVTWDDPFNGKDVVGFVMHNHLFLSYEAMYDEHPFNDWIVTKEGVGYTELPDTDNAYDNYFWKDAEGSPFVWSDSNNGDIYYIGGQYRNMQYLKKGNVRNNTSGNIGQTLGEAQKGLFEIGDRFYYTMADGIHSMKKDGTDRRFEFVPVDDKYPDGIAINGSGFYYVPAFKKNVVVAQSGTKQYYIEVTDAPGVELYTVTFVDEKGSIIEEQEVFSGKSANPPVVSERDGYVAEWIGDYTGVTKDTTVRLNYKPIEYSITYNLVKPNALNGLNPDSYTIEDSVTLNAAACPGYSFAGWYEKADYSGPVLKNFMGRTGDIVLFAKWTPNKPEKPVIKVENFYPLFNGYLLVDAGEIVTIEAESDVKICYTTDGSTPTTKSKVYDGGFAITQDTVVKAIGVRDGVAGLVETRNFEVASNEFELKDEVAQIVEGDNYQIEASVLPETKNSADIHFSSSNISIATVSDSGVITAVAEGTVTIKATIKDWRGRDLEDELQIEVGPKTFYVTFVGFNGVKIEKQPVLHGRNATAPDMEQYTPEGYEFDQWDGEFNNISGDRDVYARFNPIQYKIEFINEEGINPENIYYNIETENIDLSDIEVVAAGKNFAGWYDNAAYDGSPISVILSGSVGDRVLYAKWAEKVTLTMKWDPDNEYLKKVNDDNVAFFTYTGKAQTPAFTVYYGGKKLENKKDYTYKFVNNVNANCFINGESDTDVAKMPTLIINGKGNYAGTEKVYFNIVKKDINANDVDIVPVSLAYNKKVQKVAPVVTWNGKKLTAKDLTFDYYSKSENSDVVPYVSVGSYKVKVSGKGNYEGSVDVDLKIFNTNAAEADAKILIKSCKVSIKPFDFTGNAIDFENLESESNEWIREHIVITRGKEKVPYYKELDANGNGYRIEVVGEVEPREIGAYTVKIFGEGTYGGEVRATFKINGLNVSTMKVKPIPVQTYDGASKTPALVITSKEGEALTLGEQYKLEYQKNTDVGTATVIITGKGAYYGTRKVTFKINQQVMATDSAEWDSINVTLLGTNNPENPDCIEYDYVKGGVTPKLDVKYLYTDENGNPAEKPLIEKTDYTLVYKNNATANPVVGKEPYIVLTLKKNIKGTKNIGFNIVQKDFEKAKGLTVKVNDIQENVQPGKYMSTPAIYDVNGKKLDGKDYETAFEYRCNGVLLDKYSKPVAGDEITVTVKGKGNYKGTIKGTYRVYAKGMSIASASIKIKPEVLEELKYSGQPVVLKENNLEVKIGKTTVLNPKADYVIDAKSYVNNVNKGTAKVTIIGKGDYAGSKTISFSIKPWYLKWWEKLVGN